MRVLVVDDEERLARGLTEALGAAGYVADCAVDAGRADFLARTETYDAIVLDLGLPGVDGLTLLAGWRDAGVTVPVLVLTARGTWSDKVRGIDGGADDYLVKPFNVEELLARLRALIRRAAGHARPLLRCGALVLDPTTMSVTSDGAGLSLTAHEFRVLSYLMHHAGRVVSRAELTEHIYAQGFDRDSNTVEVFVARLRRKIGARRIETLRGLGYRMADTDASEAR